MKKQKKLTGGAQILAKTGIANYIVKIKEATPALLSEVDILRSIQDKCEIINNGDFDNFTTDILSFCTTIENQKTDYVNQVGNEEFKQYKTDNSVEKMRKVQKDAEMELNKILETVLTMRETIEEV